MRFKAIMFDLDGTLADTLADIAAAANHAMARLGRPQHKLPAFRYMVGQGLRSLMSDAVGTDHQHLIEEGMAHFTAYYAEHDMDHTRLYDGISEMLDRLSASPAKRAVLSNKPDAATRRVVSTLLGQWQWDTVRGGLDGVPLKPDPTAALQIAEELGIAPEAWAYVGDTLVDMQTAVGAGFYPIGVTWGFRDEAELREHGAKHIVHHADELTAFLLK